MNINRTSFAYVELLLSMVLLGATLILGKSLLTIFPVFLLLGIRFLIGSLVFITTTYFYKAKFDLRKLNLSTSEWMLLFLQAFFGAFLFNLLMLLGLNFTNANTAAIITSALPAFIGIFSFFILKEFISLQKLIAILLTILGIVIVNLNMHKIAGVSNTLTGNTLILLAVISGALFPICAKLLTRNIAPIIISCGFNLFGLLLFLPFAIYSLYNFKFQTIHLSVWFMVVFYSLTANVFYLQLWNRGLVYVSASTASLFTAVMPVSTAILAYFFLGETLSLLQFSGMLCVIIAIFLGVYRIRFN